MNHRRIATVVCVAAIIAGGLWWLSQRGSPPDESSTRTAVSVPALSASAREGELLFVESCAACHGENAGGSDQGPPLVHRIYEPNHHADLAFQLAVNNGVRAHHWRFGNMPPVEGLGEPEVAKITRYIRELQKENGIF